MTSAGTSGDSIAGCRQAQARRSPSDVAGELLEVERIAAAAAQQALGSSASRADRSSSSRASLVGEGLELDPLASPQLGAQPLRRLRRAQPDREQQPRARRMADRDARAARPRRSRPNGRRR